MTDQPENAREEVAAILERAASLIEPEGAWTQQRDGMPFPRSRGTPCCLGFAINQVTGRDNREVFAALYATAPFHDPISLIRWNDDPKRTQAEVVAKLREAAAKARAQVSA